MLQQNELVHRQAYSLLRVERIMTTNDVPAEQFASSSSISRRRITMEYSGGVLPGLVDGQQLDYAGGSWTSDEPYPTALDFFNSQTDFFQHEADKHVAVVVKVMREHLNLLRTSPLAVAFLPDPRYRNSISKRLWERLMYRARAILDFVEQKQHYMLFAFPHAEAKHVKAGCRNAVQDLPHPKEYGGTDEEWRTLALEHALQLHLDLAWQQKERGDFKKAILSENDYTGGSLSADILHALPGFFFSFHYLKNLACASSEMRRAVQNPQHWNDRCISLNSVEFTDGLKLRCMTRAYMSARAVSLDLRQLPLLGEFPNSMLLEWTGRGLPQLRNLTGFESAGPLLGTAVFDVILPPNAVGMYLGVRDWGDRSGRKQSFFRFDNIYTESQTLSFASGDLPPQLHRKPQRVSLQPQQSHRVLLRWKQDVMELIIDGVGVARIRPRESSPALSGPLAKFFLWVYVRPGTTNVAQEVRYRPVPSPIQHNASITCFLCHRDHDLCLPRWRVCPNCCTWICASHVLQNPTDMCPRCFNQLWDYVGGEDSQNHCSVPVCCLADICCYVKASRSVEVAVLLSFSNSL